MSRHRLDREARRAARKQRTEGKRAEGLRRYDFLLANGTAQYELDRMSVAAQVRTEAVIRGNARLGALAGTVKPPVRERRDTAPRRCTTCGRRHRQTKCALRMFIREMPSGEHRAELTAVPESVEA